MSTKISILEENARRNLGIGAGMLAAGAGGAYAGANYMANELNPIINKKHGQLVDTQGQLTSMNSKLGDTQGQLASAKYINAELHGLKDYDNQMNKLDKSLEHSGQTIAKMQGLVDQNKVPQSVLDQHINQANNIVDNKLNLMNKAKISNEFNQHLKDGTIPSDQLKDVKEQLLKANSRANRNAELYNDSQTKVGNLETEILKNSLPRPKGQTLSDHEENLKQILPNEKTELSTLIGENTIPTFSKNDFLTSVVSKII